MTSCHFELWTRVLTRQGLDHDLAKKNGFDTSISATLAWRNGLEGEHRPAKLSSVLKVIQ